MHFSHFCSTTASDRGSHGALHRAVRAVMIEAAERAIMPHFGRLAAHEIREKAGNEVVTIADRDSEEILSTGLARILPEAAVLGEEAVNSDATLLDRLGEGLSWLIDPLDGTANYAAGEGPFGILVALAQGKEPIGGWIYDPRTRRFCSAFKDEKASIDGAPIRAVASGRNPPVAAISSLFMEPNRRSEVRKRMAPTFETVAIPRCAAEQYPRVVLGLNDVTLYERTLPWDHAAGAIFLTEAGGRISRLDGSPYCLGDNRSGLIAAATPELWDQTVKLLQGLG